jgi:hypothetical protein
MDSRLDGQEVLIRLPGITICLFFKTFILTLGATYPPSQWTTEVLPSGMKLTTHFHLVPRLRTSGAVPSLPQYSFVAFTATFLPLTSIRNKNTTLTTRKSQTENDVIHVQLHLAALLE